MFTSPGVGTDRGVLIREVLPAGPAAKAGLRSGDIVTAFDGTAVPTVESFLGALRGIEPGTEIRLAVLRGGGHQTVTVTAGSTER